MIWKSVPNSNETDRLYPLTNKDLLDIRGWEGLWKSSTSTQMNKTEPYVDWYIGNIKSFYPSIKGEMFENLPSGTLKGGKEGVQEKLANSSKQIEKMSMVNMSGSTNKKQRDRKVQNNDLIVDMRRLWE